MADTATTDLGPLSRQEIEAFAVEWYRKLDEHVPAEEIVPMVSDRELEFHLPEAVLRDQAAFRNWYQGGGDLPGVINLFFDEVHTLSFVGPSWSGERAIVEVVVNWQARRWRPPSPRSWWIGFDAFQTWEMIRSATTGRPVIVRYVVNELRPMAGSPPL